MIAGPSVTLARIWLASMLGTGCSVRLIHFYVKIMLTRHACWVGGKLTNNNTIVQIALQLNEACWNTYAGDA